MRFRIVVLATAMSLGVVLPAMSTPQTIRVLQDVEVELKEALLVQPAITVRFELTPPQAPAGERWRIRVLRSDGVGGGSAAVASGSADERGTWEQQLRAGEYSVIVESRVGRWLRERLPVDAQSPAVQLAIPTVEVEGEVALGERPLECTVHFGGLNGGVSVALPADAQGRFTGFLPARDEWAEVTVVGATVRRTLRSVRVARRDGEERARVVLRIAATTITGRIVDEKGTPVAPSTVNVVNAVREPLVQLEAQADGTFDLHGLPPGPTTLQAIARGGESELVQIDVSEDEPTDVRLTVKPYKSLTGRVVSPLGAVPGAQVAVIPTDVRALVTVPVTTDERGEFVAALQSGAREVNVVVQPPGFCSKLFHMVVDQRPVEIPADQSCGTLIVDLPQFGAGARQPYLVHAAADLPLHAIRTTRFEPGTRDGWVRMRTLMLERGHYSVCLASPQEVPLLRAGQLPRGLCRSGILAPNGELALAFGED